MLHPGICRKGDWSAKQAETVASEAGDYDGILPPIATAAVDVL